MSFTLGNFAVKEVIYGVAESLGDDSEILYTLDQLSSAEIAVDSESTDITDKTGAIIRTIYNAKTATVTATSALISPSLLNASSGSDAVYGTDAAPITMPKIVLMNAGEAKTLEETATNIKVRGIYPNGANGKILEPSGTAVVDEKYGYNDTTKTVTMPAQTKTAGDPQFIVKYDYEVKGGMKLVNRADTFPKTISLTLYVAVMDPCEDEYKAAYIYIPSFTPDPSVTITMDSDNQEMDYTGNINLSYCNACEGKVLYYIYFPDEDAVISATCSTETVSA